MTVGARWQWQGYLPTGSARQRGWTNYTVVGDSAGPFMRLLDRADETVGCGWREALGWLRWPNVDQSMFPVTWRDALELLDEHQRKIWATGSCVRGGVVPGGQRCVEPKTTLTSWDSARQALKRIGDQWATGGGWVSGAFLRPKGEPLYAQLFTTVAYAENVLAQRLQSTNRSIHGAPIQRTGCAISAGGSEK